MYRYSGHTTAAYESLKYRIPNTLWPLPSFCFRRVAALSRTETKLDEGKVWTRLFLLEICCLPHRCLREGIPRLRWRGKEGGRSRWISMGGKELGRPHQTLINLGCCLGRVTFLDLFLSLSIALGFFLYLPGLAIRSRQGLLCCPACPPSRLLAGTTSTLSYLLVLDCYRRPARYFSTAPRFSNYFGVYLRIPTFLKKVYFHRLDLSNGHSRQPRAASLSLVLPSSFSPPTLLPHPIPSPAQQ
ncbi:uncharacterized protein CLUP02_02628 [Colletotrichum lupini]|uniref:Uncharacterized protein n=1 Tax=Colletotrichum lupini TaxID=145971 RepID=A0A9Q8SGW0_9PEZI|nr:uncharacterized protein CLUP02_02628 [Colletotrichum lupini]UQC77161.1 hypothetical protein CLUP02_02628 [Colletotrichum lupini]